MVGLVYCIGAEAIAGESVMVKDVPWWNHSDMGEVIATRRIQGRNPEEKVLDGTDSVSKEWR